MSTNNGKSAGRRGKTVEYKSPFAPIPRQLITDPRCSAEAVRLWGVLNGLAYERIEPSIPVIAARLSTQQHGQPVPPDERSIYRWLHQLARAGWLEWLKRRRADERFILLDGSPEDAARRQLSQLRALLDNPRSTLDDVKAMLSSDSGVTSTDPRVSTSDSGVTSTDPRVSTSDSRISTSDSGVTSTFIETHRDSIETSSYTSHPPADDDDGATPTQKLLQEYGITNSAEFAHLDYDAVRQRIERITRSEKWQPGAIVRNLRENPPTARRQAAGDSDFSGWTNQPGWRSGDDISDLNLEDDYE